MQRPGKDICTYEYTRFVTSVQWITFMQDMRVCEFITILWNKILTRGGPSFDYSYGYIIYLLCTRYSASCNATEALKGETSDDSTPQTASIKVDKNAGVSLYVTLRPEALPGLDTEISTDLQRETAAMQIVSLPAFSCFTSGLKSTAAALFKSNGS